MIVALRHADYFRRIGGLLVLIWAFLTTPRALGVPELPVTEAEQANAMKEWFEIRDQQWKLMVSGRFEEAEELSRRLDILRPKLPEAFEPQLPLMHSRDNELKQLTKLPSDRQKRIATSLASMDECGRDWGSGELGNAVAKLAQSYSDLRSELGDDSALVDLTNKKLIACMLDLRMYKECEVLQGRMRDFCKSSYGEEALDYSEVLCNEARILSASQRYEEAAAKLRKSLDIERKSKSLSSKSLIQLINVNFQLTRYEEAGGLLVLLFQWGEGGNCRIDPTDGHLANCFAGRLNAVYGKNAKARKNFEMALVGIRRAAPKSYAAVEILEALSEQLQCEGLNDEAFGYAVEAKTIRRQLDNEIEVAREAVKKNIK